MQEIQNQLTKRDALAFYDEVNHITLMFYGKKKVYLCYYKNLNKREKIRQFVGHVGGRLGMEGKEFGYVHCGCKRNKNKGYHHTLFSLDPSILEYFLSVTNRYNLTSIQMDALFGELCGIPKCCVDKLIEFHGDLLKLCRLVLKEAKEDKCNNFSVNLEGGHTNAIYHIPCSNRCKESLKIMKENTKFISSLKGVTI